MSALAALALQAGFPLIEKLLTRKLGDANGQLAAQVIRRIADRAGVVPGQIELAAEEQPGRVIDAMRDRIEAIVALIPEAWLGDDERFENVDAHRAAYVDYFVRRLEAPRPWIEEAARARTLLV